MEQFALLQQKARIEEEENDRFAANLYGGLNKQPQHQYQSRVREQELSEDSELRTPEWDIPLYAAVRAAPVEPKLGNTEDERAYYNAIASHKRGEDALVEHLERKSAKAKRARTHEQGSVDGVRLTSKNVEFNARLR